METTAEGTRPERGTRGGRKVVEGVVVSDRMQKTISVVVERIEMHRKYKKYVRRATKLKAHDEKNEARVGDVVRIAEVRPLSKLKRWRLLEVVKKAAGGQEVPK